MNEITDFRGLFETGKWPADGTGGEWTDFHGWLYITSDLMDKLVYFFFYTCHNNKLLFKKRVYKLKGNKVHLPPSFCRAATHFT